ncbi:hypothetical protein ZIOFF_006893 [Zingiber officinale]|uniref:Uncharacterized protein n=1 Tax=Zingiber officinale TaxID=94328 RepID=A0A8J5HSW5_ZINOF|nr:hypothetical protein ZIOFF_006893 [Zingiber officinale]
MARVSAVEWARGGGGCCCSFKRIAFMICCVNLVAALLVVRSLYTSFFFPPSSGISGNSLADQIMRTEESIRIRGEMEPLALVSAVRSQVRKLKKKLSGDQKRGLIQLPQPVMYKFAYEILERLQGLHNTNTFMHGQLNPLDFGELKIRKCYALEIDFFGDKRTDGWVDADCVMVSHSTLKFTSAVNLWRIQKLEVVRKEASSKSSNSSIRYQEAMWFIEMLKQALVTNWHVLMEGIGFWIAANVMNTEHDDKPENETDIAVGHLTFAVL